MNERKFSNIKLTSRFHFKYLGWWVIICIAFILLLDAALIILYEQTWNSYALTASDPMADSAFRYSHLLTTLGIVTLFLSAGIVILAMTTAHRIAGPYLGLQRTFDAIKNGQLDHRIKFRKEDGLDELESSFNTMIDELQQKIEKSK